MLLTMTIPVFASRKSSFAATTLVAFALAGTACSASKKPVASGIGNDFVEVFPVAQRTCDASLSREVLGRTVTVRYPSALGADTARRFLEGLAAFQGEREADYEILRSGLRSYLGDVLYAKVENKPFLRAPELETTWFLLRGEEPKALMWRGPENSHYYYLRESPDGNYRDEDLRMRSSVDAEVHEFTHWTLWSLRTSKAILPRWFEEGTSDYMAMNFRLWKEKKWDQSKEVVARLVWNRPAVREQLFAFPDFNRGMSARRRAFRLSEWESDLLYKGSLGLVFAMETELGRGGLADFYREILTKTPESDSETVAVIERKVGKPIREMGLMPAEARRRILEDLLDRAAKGCERGAPSSEQIPLSALGHFPEVAGTVVPVLESLALCQDPQIAIEGITGLRYLGRIDPLKETFARLQAVGTPELLATLEKEGGFQTAREFVNSGSASLRFFKAEAVP